MDANSNVRLSARVFGTVQGVGFRYWTARKAEELGLSGLAENLDDGSVAVTAEGPEDGVNDLLAWLRSADAPGKVERVEEHIAAAQGGFQGFTTR